MSSIDASLREQWPELTPMALSKRVVLAVSRAIERHVLERATNAVLIGGFQRDEFWRASEERWRRLAARAHTVIVLADLLAPARRENVHEVPLNADAPLRREWLVLCDSPSASALLVAAERTTNAGVPDTDRVFDAWWTVDPTIVREAARIGAAIASTEDVTVLDTLGRRLAGEPVVTVESVTQATKLTAQIVAELERLRR